MTCPRCSFCLGFALKLKHFSLPINILRMIIYIIIYIYINLDQKRTHRIQFSRQDAAPVAGVKGSAAWRLRTGEQIWASARHARHTRHATFWSVAPSWLHWLHCASLHVRSRLWSPLAWQRLWFWESDVWLGETPRDSRNQVSVSLHRICSDFNILEL